MSVWVCLCVCVRAQSEAVVGTVAGASLIFLTSCHLFWQTRLLFAVVSGPPYRLSRPVSSPHPPTPPDDCLCPRGPRRPSLLRPSFMPRAVGPAPELDSSAKSFCSSFLPACNLCVNRITERGVVLGLSCHVNPPPHHHQKNMPASTSCRQFLPPPDSLPHFPVKICYESDMKRLMLLFLFIAQFLMFGNIVKTFACEARQRGNNISLYYFFISALLTAWRYIKIIQEVFLENAFIRLTGVLSVSQRWWLSVQ